MENHKLWKSIAAKWKHHCPPGIPSEDDQKLYEELMLEGLEGKEKKKVLVLGATPEIRNIIAKHDDIDVTIIDQNMEMILAMTELMTKENKNEKWIQGNWLTVDYFNHYFDVVMGDLVICNILKDNQEQFISQIKRFLKHGGYWISRIYSICNYTEFKSVNQLLKEYDQKDKIGDFEISEFLRQAGITYWNDKTQHIELKYLGEELKSIMENQEKWNELSSKQKKIVQEVYDLFAPFNINFFITYEKETDKILGKSFIIEKKIMNEWATQFKEKGYFMYKLKSL